MANDLADALVAVLGAAKVDHDVAPYLRDSTENLPGRAELVVKATCADDVVATLRVAADHGAAVTPVVANYNVAGLAIPAGGIVLDLTGLDRVIEIDRDTMVAVLEPGVTFEALKAHLDEHAPELTYGYPFAPPATSVVANALLDGLSNLSLRYGAMGQWCHGVEAVLADGTVVRTGAGSVVESWFGRAPLPDLTGLFISMQGATGVVTKAAVALQPRPAHRDRWFAFVYDLGAAHRVMDALARTGSIDDIGAMTWPAAKMLFGATRDLRRDDDEPLAFLFIDITGASAAELASRRDIAAAALRDAGIVDHFTVEDLLALVPRYRRLAELPATLDFLLDFPGGGLTWVGSYGPGKRWVEGAEKGLALLEESGFPPLLVSRPMAGGHFWVLRFVACFDRDDDAEVARVRDVMGRLAEHVLDMGYIPYKPSADATKRLLARAHPGFVELLRRVGDALDPDGRMNPGRWELPS